MKQLLLVCVIALSSYHCCAAEEDQEETRIAIIEEKDESLKISIKSPNKENSEATITLKIDNNQIKAQHSFVVATRSLSFAHKGITTGETDYTVHKDIEEHHPNVKEVVLEQMGRGIEFFARGPSIKGKAPGD